MEFSISIKLKMNVKNYPENVNAYDSLGEVYFEAGDYQNAWDNYKKSVDLNPENAHGKEMLERIKDSLNARMK